MVRGYPPRRGYVLRLYDLKKVSRNDKKITDSIKSIKNT